MREKIKIGILGCGDFSMHFVPLFREHPFVEKVCVADIDLEKTVDHSAVSLALDQVRPASRAFLENALA